MSESPEVKPNRFSKEKILSLTNSDAKAMYLIDSLSKSSDISEINEIHEFVMRGGVIQEFTVEDIESILGLLKNKKFEFDSSAMDKNSFADNLAFLEAVSENPELTPEQFKEKIQFLINALEFRDLADYIRVENVLIKNIKLLKENENALVFKVMAQRLSGILLLEIRTIDRDNFYDIKKTLKKYAEFIKFYLGEDRLRELQLYLEDKEKIYG